MGRFPAPLTPAKEEQIISIGDVRISVITDRILRLEKGQKSDNRSQMVVCRNFYNPEFKYTIDNNKVSISTKSCQFNINLKTLKCSYVLSGNEVFPSNKTNLGGTARTLDGTFGVLGKWKSKIEFKDHFCLGHIRKGIFASTGIVEIDDSKNLLLNEDGGLFKRNEGAVDKYIFAFGNDYLGGLKEFYGLCGYTPILPKYALGNWWSRYHAYSDKEYLDLMDKFESKDIPLTVATIDMDWHIVKNVPNDVPRTTFQGPGWTGYTFEKSLFPDYKAFLKNLKNRGLAITMNLHPKDGIRYYEKQYDDVAKACDIDPKSKKPVIFNLCDEKFLNAYFDLVHHPYEEEGVDFWWIDWQQGTKYKPMDGIDALWLLNHYHMLDNCRNKNGMILSRYAGLGSHRYPLGFSGDTFVLWKSLNFQPWFTSLASNAGYTWWSHDIGGHVLSHGNEELYLRWLQFGVFSPINRLHSNNIDISKEPWLYPHVESIANDYLRLRHKLLPYLYTANIKTATEGIPIISPMYYYCDDERVHKKEYKNQYYFGEQMLVAPVTAPGKNGVSKLKIFLPNGIWYNFFTGKEFVGGKEFEYECPLNEYPVFVKKGAIIPLINLKKGNSLSFNDINVKVYLGDCNFTLFDENGKVEFEMTQNDNVFLLNIKKFDRLKTGILNVYFENLDTGEIELNGSKLEFKKGEPITIDGSLEKAQIVIKVSK